MYQQIAWYAQNMCMGVLWIGAFAYTLTMIIVHWNDVCSSQNKNMLCDIIIKNRSFGYFRSKTTNTFSVVHNTFAHLGRYTLFISAAFKPRCLSRNRDPGLRLKLAKL